MLFTYLIAFLLLAVVVSEISWEHCGKRSDDVRLLNLTVSPDPIVAPGSVSITIVIQTNHNLTRPLKATLSLRKKILIGYFPVPCSAIGQCTYDDLCTVCTQCNCSVPAGKHTFTLPITIQSGSWLLSGSYQAQIDLETGAGQKACVNITNVLITTRK